MTAVLTDAVFEPERAIRGAEEQVVAHTKDDAAEVDPRLALAEIGKLHLFIRERFAGRLVHGVQSRDNAISAVAVPIDGGQRFVYRLVRGAYGFLKRIGHTLVENMQIAHAHRFFIAVEVRAVESVGEPHGIQRGIVPCAVRRDRGRRSRAVRFLVPAAGFSHRLYVELAFLLERGEFRELIGQTGAHGVPAEAVFLPRLRIAEAEALTVKILAQIPVHPFRNTAAPAVSRAVHGLKGDHPLAGIRAIVGIHAEIVLTDLVGAEHTEQRRGQLLLRTLRRHEYVGRAWVIRLSVVAAPEGIAVGAVLLFAVAQRVHVVFARHVADGVGIKEPRAEHARILPEHLLEFAEEFVDHRLALRLGISDREAAVAVPVPRPAAGPWNTARVGQLLHDLVPDTELIPRGIEGTEQIREFRQQKRVVLKEKRGAQVVFVDEPDLLPHDPQQIDRLARLYGTDEVDNVDDLSWHDGIPHIE